MGLTRATFYDAPPATLPDPGILAPIGTIRDEVGRYGTGEAEQRCVTRVWLADRVGFEPTVRVNAHTLSKRAP